MTIAPTAPARRALDGLPVVISTFTNKYDDIPRQETLTWGALRERLSVHQHRMVKEGRLFSPVSYKDGATRGKAGVDRIFFAVADIDNPEPNAKGGGVSDEDVITPERFLEQHPPDLEVLIVSTHSSTPERPKFRALSPLTTPCAGQDWGGDDGIWKRIEAHVWKAALGQSYKALDRACKNADRFYYLPSCPPDAVSAPSSV